MSARMITLTIVAFCLCIQAASAGPATEPTTKPALPPPNEALMHAIKKGDVELVKKLMVEGAPADTAGIPPLWYAAVLRRHEIAKVLLDHGADPNIGESCGETCDTAPLQVATANEDATIVKLLLGAGVRKRLLINKCLIVAARRGNREIVVLLLEAGADPNWKDPGRADETAIQAAMPRHPDVANLMRQKKPAS